MSETVTTPSEIPGNSPGAVLKRCREYHDITLEEAAQATKIAISYLKSLEEDHVSGFANITYLKGFLRIYATYLGLNPDDMARMYDKLYGAKDGKDKPEFTSSKRLRPAFRLASFQKLVLPAVLLLLILITAALFKRQPLRTISLSQLTPPASALLPVASAQKVLTSSRIRTAPPVAEESRAESGKAAINGSDQQPLPLKPAGSDKGFILKIKVIQNGNLNAAVDGSGMQSYELTVGDIIEWKVEKSATLDLSNAGGVDVELNGKHLKQLGPSGKAAYVVLDVDGVKP